MPEGKKHDFLLPPEANVRFLTIIFRGKTLQITLSKFSKPYFTQVHVRSIHVDQSWWTREKALFFVLSSPFYPWYRPFDTQIFLYHWENDGTDTKTMFFREFSNFGQHVGFFFMCRVFHYGTRFPLWQYYPICTWFVEEMAFAAGYARTHDELQN